MRGSRPATYSEQTGGRSAAEREFISAILDYKQSSGRMFPTWSEVLEVAQSLGYVKPGSAAAASTL